jgi:uncharacterized membrane protein
MGTLLLLAGVLLWSGAHFWKRLAPAHRAGFGDKGKGIAALAILASVGLMIVGYRMADPVWLWQEPAFFKHINNLLVFLGFYLYAVSGMQTALARKIRHPQLTAVKAWALAHLLVVGTLQGVILFGGLLAWAVVSVILINRANRDWTRPTPAPLWKEGAALVGAVIVTGAVGWLHGWLGPTPFGG